MRRGIKLALAAVAVALVLPAAASAQDHTVTVTEQPLGWAPSEFGADPGETVRWLFETPDGEPLTLGHDVEISEVESGTKLASSPLFFPGPTGQYFDHEFLDEGRFRYVCTIHANTMRGVVQVGTPPPVGDPELYLGLKRKRARGKVRKVTSFPAIIRNTGDALMQDAMVCAKAPRRLVKVTNGRCASYAGLDEGEGRQPKFTFKPKKRARGRKVRIKFIASATGLPSKTKRATLKVRR